MKKLFLLGGIASLLSVSVYATTLKEKGPGRGATIGGGVECPQGCYGGNLKCCVTRGGSTYYTRG